LIDAFKGKIVKKQKKQEDLKEEVTRTKKRSSSTIYQTCKGYLRPNLEERNIKKR
jgi:hypothetical protein